MEGPEMNLDRGWAGAARFWGIAAGLGFAVTSILYTADVLGWIGTIPVYAATAAGQVEDEAAYWAAVFAYRHATLWDVMVRDAVCFFSFLGLLPFYLAANAATGGRRAALEISGAFVAAAAIFGPSTRSPSTLTSSTGRARAGMPCRRRS
jgi:hypothetical protein